MYEKDIYIYIIIIALVVFGWSDDIFPSCGQCGAFFFAALCVPEAGCMLRFLVCQTSISIGAGEAKGFNENPKHRGLSQLRCLLRAIVQVT